MNYIDRRPSGREEGRAVSIVREEGRAVSIVRDCNIYRDYIVSSYRHRIYISCGLFFFSGCE